MTSTGRDSPAPEPARVPAPAAPATPAPAEPQPTTWSDTFPATPERVREARQFLAGVLGGCPAADDALLCLSELAANAVLHSRSRRPGGKFAVHVSVRPGTLRVEVEDEGGPWRQCDNQDGEAGRGLMIVAALARDCGQDGDDTRRVTWFEAPYP
jgi:serine/threonine-protein kinase RsbW